MPSEIKNFVKFSLMLADTARQISLFYFKKKVSVINKNKFEFDPVTIADIKIQKKLNKVINKTFPDHSIFGEEESFIKKGEYEWCIDPIDGTKSYIQGVPLWGTLISLSKNKKIILGLADIPALDERYLGYLNFSYKIKNNKKKKLKVRNTNKLSEVILNTTSPYVFANKKDQRSFERLSKKTKSTRLGGDCYSYCLLADGHVDVVVESGLKPWDIRALEPIILNAGGIIRTWDNKEIHNGGSIIACNNKRIFRESRSILNKKKPSQK
jgi:myo-inositol-1(or 4)-monophosphatase